MSNDLDLIRSAHEECVDARPPPGPSVRRLVERLDPIIRWSARTAGVKPDGRVTLHDHVQNAWLKLTENDWRRLRSYDPGRGTLESFVAMITRQAIAEATRSLEARASFDPFDEDTVEIDTLDRSGPERRAAEREMIEGLLAHLRQRLTSRTWLVFVLKYRDHLSDPEIAGLIGLDRQNVYNATSTIRRHAAVYFRAREVSRDTASGVEVETHQTSAISEVLGESKP